MDFNLFEITPSKYLNGLLIFIFFLIIAKIVDVFVTRTLKGAVSRTSWKFDDRIVEIIHYPLFFTVLIAGILETTYYISPPMNIGFYVSGVFQSLGVIIWTIALYRLTSVFMEALPTKIAFFADAEKELAPLFENLTKVVIIGAAIMVLLSVWNKNITPIVASAGIAGFAVAFAAKDTIANFFGGISVFMDKPYRIGDYVILDSGERGAVVAIGLRSTKMLTRDEVLISIPNSIMASSKIINQSAPKPRFRVRVPIGVAYGSDIDKVEELLIDIASDNKYVTKKPIPRVRFRSFGGYSLEFELLAWVIEPKYMGRVVHIINKEIYARFAKEGIEIPYPKMDIYMKK